MSTSHTSSSPRTAVAYALSPRFLLAGSFLIYLGFAFWFALGPNYATTPVLDVRRFAPTLAMGLSYGLLILALFAMSITLYRQAYTGRFRPGLAGVLAGTVLFSAPLLLTYPINANDIFRYIIRGRIGSVYGANPFLMAPDDFPGDIYVAYAGEWRAATSPYGPLWESGASWVTRLAGDDLLAGLILFKLLGLLAVLAVAWLIWLLLRDETDAPRRQALTLLWAWNPAILLTAVANGHNDMLMLAALLLGWLAIRRGYPGPGMALAFVGPLLKPIGLLALPFLFIDAWRSLGDAQRRQLPLLLWTAVGGGLLILVAFRPYGDPTVVLPRLIAEASGGSSFAPFTLLFLFADRMGWRLPFATITRLLPVLYLGYFLWLLWRSAHGRRATNLVPRAFYGYLLQALNFRIWYASWPFPWLILDAAAGKQAGRRALEAGVWFLLTAQLSVLIHGHFRFDVFNDDVMLTHLLGVPFVFFLPLLMPFLVRLTPPEPRPEATG